MEREEFKRKWLETFIPDLTKKQYNECYVYQYLWHIFSYGLIPKEKVLSGKAAREAYKNINKEDAIIIQIWDDDEIEETSEITDNYKQWEYIEDIPELYIVGKNWKWTYVSTHENGWCGPYFYKID